MTPPVLIEYKRMEPSEINVIRGRIRSRLNHVYRDAPEDSRPRVVMSGERKHLRFYGLEIAAVERLCSELNVPGKPYCEKAKQARAESIMEFFVPQPKGGLETKVEKAIVQEEPVVEKKTRGPYKPQIAYGVMIPAILKVVKILEKASSKEILEQLKLDGLDIGYPTLVRRLGGMTEHGLLENENNRYKLK